MRKLSTSRMIFVVFLLMACARANSQDTRTVYLSGTDKEHTVDWEFFCTKGRNSNKWTTIAVPSQWELQGFGSYSYGHDKEKLNEEGRYRHHFHVPREWSGNVVRIVFEGSMTDTEVYVNGRSAGPVHQGGFYRFSYDITELLKPGRTNLLEVNVKKGSSNPSIEKAERGGDFWAFGGIFRPVYLQILPRTHIQRIAIDARHGGDFNLQVYTRNTSAGNRISARIFELDGSPIGDTIMMGAADSTQLKTRIASAISWNAEKPYLYEVEVSLLDKNRIVHRTRQRFGFRTAELRPGDGFYVNDVKVVLKGVNRHSSWPTSGRTLSREIHLLDIDLMKQMNMNAVRMSHYPPDTEFLDLCDSLGLFVLNELTGWQAAYDTVAGRKLVRALVERDVNHPSVIMWANGNEGGWNRALDPDFHLYDPQRRLVYHPWEKFNGTDTKHYPDYQYVVNSVLHGREVYFPTEFMHGLYDGGHGAGLDDFWDLMSKHPHFAGGFLWSLADEGIVRVDKDSIIDTDGNHAPDGIVGPFREKEGSFFTIREIWSPVSLEKAALSDLKSGNMYATNNYLYTNLSECILQWKLVNFPGPHEDTAEQVVASDSFRFPSIAPGERKRIKIPLIHGNEADALKLVVSDWTGTPVYEQGFVLRKSAAAHVKTNPRRGPKVNVENNDGFVSITCDSITYVFSKDNGYLSEVRKQQHIISFGKGPAPEPGEMPLKSFDQHWRGDSLLVIARYGNKDYLNVTWTFSPGMLPLMEYNYGISGQQDYLGISFMYPEEQVKSIKWLGKGPYRVWKNRLKGVQTGVWSKNYNNTITGESWEYPEFKGWHANMQWMRLETTEGAFTIYSENDDLFLGLYKPQKPAGASNNYTDPPFSTGSISFMHAISAIGTKFQAAGVMGPQSSKNQHLNYKALSGALYFDFR